MQTNNRIKHIIKETSAADLSGKTTFMGIEAHPSTPIEVVAAVLIGAEVEYHTILILDKFQEMNGANARYIADGKAALKSRIEVLVEAYYFKPELDIEDCSSFMETTLYNSIYKDVERQITGSRLEEDLRKSIPAGVYDFDLEFALHEVAVTRYMQLEKGVQVKIGQQREKLYDGVIGGITGMEFAYLFPSFAFVTGEEVKTPYNPQSGTRNGGKRIFLGANPDAIVDIMKKGPAEAQIAIGRIGLAAEEVDEETRIRPRDVTLADYLANPNNCIKSIMGIVEEYEAQKLRSKFDRYRDL